MHQNFKKLYHSLKYYANHNKEDIIRIKGNEESLFRSHVPERIEKLLYYYKYISDNEEECFDPLYMVTREGSEYLIKLDNIFYKDWKFWIALIGTILGLGRIMNWW